MIDVRVVSAGPLMAPVFAALHSRAFAAPWSAAAFAATLAGPGTVTVVATGGDAASHDAPPVGFAIARLTGPEAEILTLAVDPDHRRRGVGQRLVAALLEAAQAAGAAALFLEVDVTNDAARALYAAAGFTATGRRPGYYQTADGARRDAVLMRAVLAGHDTV